VKGNTKGSMVGTGGIWRQRVPVLLKQCNYTFIISISLSIQNPSILLKKRYKSMNNL
jgi:hypothetical protein